jgi:hypothetical protein
MKYVIISPLYMRDLQRLCCGVLGTSLAGLQDRDLYSPTRIVKVVYYIRKQGSEH